MRGQSIASLGLLLMAATSTVAWAETVSGEVVDTFCYATMGAKGASHKPCGIDCAKKGIPVGLLEQGTNKLYVLLPSKDKTALPDDVIAKMGSTATVTGKVHTSGGDNFLTVESVK
jgi:hypothetical protein